jgi:NAD(P)-dependent dehydrogenase (short-subunit alcohol dehydrogenase family)
MLDITDQGQIASLVARIDGDPHGRPLRAVVNNAGIGDLGPAGTFPIPEWRRTFEVNFFGTIAVTQALLPALLRSKGRVVNISSVGGKVAMAGWSPYASSKYALEAVTDSLRRELAPHGVRVVVVEPAFVRTEMAGHGVAAANQVIAQMTPDQKKWYGALMHAVAAQLSANAKKGLAVEKAARVVAKAVTDRRPRTRYAIGAEAATTIGFIRIMPDRVLDRVLAAGLRPHYPKNG